MRENEPIATMTAGNIGIQVFIAINDKHYVIDKEGEWQHKDLTTEEGSVIVQRINAPDPIEIIGKMEKRNTDHDDQYERGYDSALSELKRRLTEVSNGSKQTTKKQSISPCGKCTVKKYPVNCYVCPRRK